MPLLHSRALPLSLVALTFAHPGLAQGADTDLTTPPRINLLGTSRFFSTNANQFTAADLDGDGDQDLVHLPEGGSGQEGDPHAYWMENLGGRQFGPLRLIHLGPTDAGQTLTGAKVWDLTGDSKPEIFVNRRQSPQQDLYRPLALTPGLDDQIAAPVEPTILTGFSTTLPWDLVDLDGTGTPYLVQIFGASGAGQTTVSISKRMNTGTGDPFQTAFEVTSLYFAPAIVVDFDATDVDGDGDGDLCLACSDSAMRIYERTMPWNSSAEPRVRVLPDPWAKWIDLDGDGRKDILHGDGSWQRNDGNWNFSLRPQSPAYDLLENAIFTKVIPRAGQSALVHAIVPAEEGGNPYDRLVIPFDSATPLSRQAAVGNHDTGPAILYYGDLDGDGHLDLAYTHIETETYYYGSRIIEVVWGSPASFSAPQLLHAGISFAHHVFAADFNGDLLPDLVSGPDALGRFRIRYNAGVTGKPLGDGVIIEGLDIPGTELDILGAARIDKDKYPDLVCSYLRTPVDEDGPEHAIVVVRGRKDGSFIKPVIPAGGLSFASRPGLDGGGMDSRNFVDWDRDGDLDLVAGGLWYENVKGSFPGAPRVLVELGTMPDFLGNPATIGGTITGDIDGDRAPEIISLVHGTGTLEQPPGKMLVGFNDGRGGIEETLELPFQLAAYDFLGNPTLQGGAAIAELNGDKRRDLWVRVVAGTDNSGNSITADGVLLNPGRRRAREIDSWNFVPLSNADVKIPPGVAFGDFDGDRKAVSLAKNSGEWLSPWGYIQHAGRLPRVSEPYDFTNHHIDLTKVAFVGGLDIDGDRDTDFVLGGDNFPLVLLYNPNADGGKRRPMKAKPVAWLGSLPVVR